MNSIGEQKLIGKSLYFAKAIYDKAISKQGANDNEVLFGEVSGRSLYLKSISRALDYLFEFDM